MFGCSAHIAMSNFEDFIGPKFCVYFFLTNFGDFMV